MSETKLESALRRVHYHCNSSSASLIPRATESRVLRFAKQMLRLKDYLSAVPEEKPSE